MIKLLFHSNRMGSSQPWDPKSLLLSCSMLLSQNHLESHQDPFELTGESSLGFGETDFLSKLMFHTVVPEVSGLLQLWSFWSCRQQNLLSPLPSCLLEMLQDVRDRRDQMGSRRIFIFRCTSAQLINPKWLSKGQRTCSIFYTFGQGGWSLARTLRMGSRTKTVC